jgi:hypothetical protein
MNFFTRIRHWLYGNGHADRLRPLDKATARMNAAGLELQRAVAEAAQREDPLQGIVHSLQNRRVRRWIEREEREQRGHE